MSERAAVLTISSSLARGEGDDVSGPALVRLCEAAGLEVQHEVVSDDRESILAALTVYDMVKGLERGVEIAEVVLLEKSGGRHDWRREP